ncbi:XXYS1_4_G0042970.mRNA.1.CDS.1 [Saccharomyces cerevisiae]|nr:EM14S01-3B_G0040450.mRNA.1.CDS.1 [Saccharomyces cerevisiae]CAD6637882.1 XXYS1_4_G0042970.mRNA.1.CDS.1 [Saccharomyces cerevisiae]CAI4710123.1 AMH_1a_G0038700.mRNA.1.CDS.1 [Saccharomyces cerevisiae]CAI4710322.1 CEI_1a_G0038570.mRNA.1.CDS.1 [Saccharomyces cerevisiae]CAI6848317.1 AMH_1a_G0038700.mRNA.1.CDS.1 [Saccharomyces cerevisiae]
MSTQGPAGKDGAFKRQASSFKETISKQHPIYKPAKGRYWLYVSLACPWAHRTLVTRALKGLTSVIGCSVVHWHLDEKGWRFLDLESAKSSSEHWHDPAGGVVTAKDDASKSFAEIENDSQRLFLDGTNEPHYGFKRLSDLYYKSDPQYSARFTVPVLWDLETQTIVNNESSEIIRILNSNAFDDFVDEKYKKLDLVPKQLEAQIDDFNSWVYDNINNGVYKTGFAEKAEIYEKEVRNVFEHLDKVEKILGDKYAKLEAEYGEGEKEKILSKFFTVGDQLTEADIRLYTTIVRFDAVYVQHFKCNFTTIRAGYPFIHQWVRNLYWNYDAFKYTTDFNHIKLHYTRSHIKVNPLGITALGPKPDIHYL